MKILCIDDNKDMTKVFEEYFSNKGHRFYYTNDGHEGLKLIKERSSDVILLDVGMPYFSGLDIIEELAKDGSINSYNIVVLTGASMKDLELAKLIRKGVKGYIRKPVKMESLLSEIERFSINN